jgi:hypothetical protein
VSGLLELLRPPPHRGPLIAAGAVLVTVGVALEEIRLDDELPSGAHLVILALAAGVIYALGVQVRQEGRPYAFQSVLLVCGLLLMYPALLTLADVLGADFDDFPAGAFVWTSLALAGAALWPAVERNSSICALIAALALGVAALSFVSWAFDATSLTTYRWLLALCALGYVLVSLRLRDDAEPRHSEQLVNAAGLAILALALTGPTAGSSSCSRRAAGSWPTAPSTARPARATSGSRTWWRSWSPPASAASTTRSTTGRCSSSRSGSA